MALGRDVIDASAFRAGLVLGPLLVLVGYVAVLTRTDLVLDDRGLLVVAAWPAATAAVVALVVPGQRRRAVGAALGSLVGTALVVAVVGGAIWAFASLLSDPAPPAP